MQHGGRETFVVESREHQNNINNAIEHFLYVECFRDEQKLCLNLVRQGQDIFAILPTGSGESLIFQLFPRIMNVIKGKLGVSISTIITIAHLVAIRNTKLKRFGISAATVIGWGQEESMGEDTAMWKEDVKSFMEAQKAKKKSCLKGYLAAIKRLKF